MPNRKIILFLILFLGFFFSSIKLSWTYAACDLISETVACHEDANYGSCGWVGGTCGAGDGWWEAYVLMGLDGAYGCLPAYPWVYHHRSWCASEDAACCSGGDCFAPGTKVNTPEGDKPIENISIGEQISSFDPKTSQSSASSVEQTFQYDKGGYYQLKLKDGQELKVTENHPLYTIQKTEEPFTFWQYFKTESLTKKLVDYLFK